MSMKRGELKYMLSVPPDSILNERNICIAAVTRFTINKLRKLNWKDYPVSSHYESCAILADLVEHLGYGILAENIRREPLLDNDKP